MAVDKNKRNSIIGRLALLVTTMIWGTSFVILKSTLDTVPLFYILAFRFTGAAVLLLLLGIKEIKKLDKEHLKGGCVMGLFLFVAYVFQTYGLVYTTPGKNAFLTATYCVIVPFLYWAFYKRKPDKYNITAALMSIIGIGLVSLNENFSVGLGEGLTTVCGLFYALHIIATAGFAKKGSIVMLSMLQFAVCGALSWVFALTTETFPSQISQTAVFEILYITVMCTAVCFSLQTLGQRYTPPSAVAIILTLESVFGAAISVIFYGERLTSRLLLGFAVIFLAILTSETKFEFLRNRQKGENKKDLGS